MATSGFNLTNVRRLSADTAGNLYAVDPTAQLVLQLVPYMGGFMANPLCGGTAGFTDGTSDLVQFQGPTAISCSATGDCYVADLNNFAIRKVTTGGTCITVAGTGTSGNQDGTGGRTGSARFGNISDVALDRVSGILYVADASNNSIRAVAPDGSVTTYAQPFGAQAIATDGIGHIYWTDGYTLTFALGGLTATLAGSSAPGNSDGQGCGAQFNGLFGLAAPPAGHQVWATDVVNNSLRSIVY
jgi:hypothetical protein